MKGFLFVHYFTLLFIPPLSSAQYYPSGNYYYQPYVVKPTPSPAIPPETTTAKSTSTSVIHPTTSAPASVNLNHSKESEFLTLNSTTQKPNALETKNGVGGAAEISLRLPENLGPNNGSETSDEKNIDKEVTKITLEKTTTTIEQSVPEKINPESGQKVLKGVENPRDDTDVNADDLLETARDSRKTDPLIKTEASTHAVQLDKITEKLNSTVDFEVIRELLGSLVGPAKAEAILPKSHFNDKLVLSSITKTKRSISPDKLVKHKISKQQLKLLLKQSKSGKGKTKYRVKRETSGMYDNNFPVSLGQIPELVGPAPTKDSNTEMVSQTNSYNHQSDVSIPEFPALRSYSYAVRHPIPSSSIDIESRIKPTGSKNYANSDAPLIRNYQSTRSASPKYLTDLSDLPISRDYPVRQSDSHHIIGNVNVKTNSDRPVFQNVKITYEYTTPILMSIRTGPTDTTPSRVSNYLQFDGLRIAPESFRSTYGSQVADELRSKYDAEKVRTGKDTSERTAMSEVPLLMPDVAPIKIAFDVTSLEGSRRYKRATSSKEKRRVPMVLSTVSRLTRSGPF